ncbi:DUF92 domain-containing protein [Niabella insulamsoli]|uniref:DUF92 domain-containing protein n=1 Tax=Niabella insulamsoli TaxID=3144874 RepID=UPI0031FC5FD6
MFHEDWLLMVIVAAGILLSVFFRKLTWSAALLGGLICILIYSAAGWGRVACMAAFFGIGIGVTSFRLKEKQAAGLAERDKGKRKAGQVFANGAVAAIISVAACFFPFIKEQALVLIAACFASATADTVSSEMGNIYGRRFYHVLSFKKVQRGANGVVSAEGTGFGILGSMAIAVIYYCFEPSAPDSFIIIIAGTLGNLLDSVLGAAFENRGYLSNDAVNFLNTAGAAIVAWLLVG